VHKNRKLIFCQSKNKKKYKNKIHIFYQFFRGKKFKKFFTGQAWAISRGRVSASNSRTSNSSETCPMV